MGGWGGGRRVNLFLIFLDFTSAVMDGKPWNDNDGMRERESELPHNTGQNECPENVDCQTSSESEG